MINRRRISQESHSSGLSPELRELDRELSAIRIEERPSFAPELEGELLQIWGEMPDSHERNSRPGIRILLAACMACLMVAGLSVPSARAAVSRLVRTVMEEAAPTLFAPESELELPEISVEEPEEAPSSTEATARAAAGPPLLDLEKRPLRAGNDLPEVEFSYPEIRYRKEAEALILSYYPVALQRAGVGGAVRLMLWVTADGTVENVQMREGSGYRSLNLAAMKAARGLRFNPATRAGTSVGTYVEFTVNFVPPNVGGESDFDATPPKGPTG